MDSIKELLEHIQRFASEYFQTVFKTIIPFWLMAKVPNGANILTGVFGAFLIVAARFERSLASNAGDLFIVFPLVFVCVVFLSGISLLLDSEVENKFENFQRLISVTCVGVSLSCGLIAFAWIVEWTRPFAYVSDRLGLGETGTNNVLSAAAALIVVVLLFVNTIFNVGRKRALLSPRSLLWTLGVFSITALGTGLALFQGN